MAKPRYRTHHGMVDILPEESRKWQALEDIIRSEARRFHFEEIRTPIMEQTELVVRSVGQLTDIVSKAIFSFSRGADNYVLRPENTASVARAYTVRRLDKRGGAKKV